MCCEVATVGSAWTGNLHPTPTIELMQGIRGDAGCMAKARVYSVMHCQSHRALCCIRLACTLTHLSHPMCICTYREARLFICTGAPIQPHDCTGLDGLPVRYRWAKIPPLTFAHINLDGVCVSPSAFKEAFGIAQQEPGNMDEYDNEEDLFADVHHPLVSLHPCTYSLNLHIPPRLPCHSVPCVVLVYIPILYMHDAPTGRAVHPRRGGVRAHTTGWCQAHGATPVGH